MIAFTSESSALAPNSGQDVLGIKIGESFPQRKNSQFHSLGQYFRGEALEADFPAGPVEVIVIQHLCTLIETRHIADIMDIKNNVAETVDGL